KNRECLFGHIADGEMILNDAGQMIESAWLKLPERFTNIELHEYIVMPNHFHAILQIVGATLVVAQNDMIDATEKGQPQGIAPTQKIKKTKPLVIWLGRLNQLPPLNIFVA
ncbi:MAG: hypothetical protein H8E98_07330, partial [Bacteroidetes bacterium]|nr:hypothetical protein [Bacteroidota bacterium]